MDKAALLNSSVDASGAQNLFYSTVNDNESETAPKLLRFSAVAVLKIHMKQSVRSL